MAFDDLDLEFEDEEEAKKKKNEAVQVDVDLEFGSSDPSDQNKSRSSIARPAAPAGAAPPGVKPPPIAPSKPGQVKNLSDARVAAAAKTAGAVSTAPMAGRPQVAAPRVMGSSALQTDGAYDLEVYSIVEMREQMKRIEFEAEVKVAVAEFKTELLSELMSDVKLMQHQVEQLLIRINAKHPDMKQEVLMIKKILADFSAKKRK